MKRYERLDLDFEQFQKYIQRQVENSGEGRRSTLQTPQQEALLVSSKGYLGLRLKPHWKKSEKKSKTYISKE